MARAARGVKIDFEGRRNSSGEVGLGRLCGIMQRGAKIRANRGRRTRIRARLMVDMVADGGQLGGRDRQGAAPCGGPGLGRLGLQRLAHGEHPETLNHRRTVAMKRNTIADRCSPPMATLAGKEPTRDNSMPSPVKASGFSQRPPERPALATVIGRMDC